MLIWNIFIFLSNVRTFAVRQKEANLVLYYFRCRVSYRFANSGTVPVLSYLYLYCTVYGMVHTYLYRLKTVKYQGNRIIIIVGNKIVQNVENACLHTKIFYIFIKSLIIQYILLFRNIVSCHNWKTAQNPIPCFHSFAVMTSHRDSTGTSMVWYPYNLLYTSGLTHTVPQSCIL